MKKILIVLLIIALVGCGKKEIKPSYISNVAVVETNDQKILVDRSLDSFIFSGKSLPSSKDFSALVKFNVLEGNAYIEDNKLYKKDSAQEIENIVLEGLFSDGSTVRYERIKLLDPLAGYLISYFNHEGDEKESLKLAYTYNGYLWYTINNDKSILKPSTGTKQLRDPSFVRNKEGELQLIGTQGWDNPSIYCFDVDEKINFINERLLKVNSSSSEMTMSEKQAWAPEAFYDRYRDTTVIVWSSPKDDGMFVSFSNDLLDISYPRQLVDVGYPIIDGTIVKDGYKYTMYYKDERMPMEEYSRIYRMSGNDYLNFTDQSDVAVSGFQCEGPFVMKSDYHVFIFYDDYTRKQYLASITYDVFSDYYETIDMNKLVIPIDKPSHGSSIAVTWKELERFIERYDK